MISFHFKRDRREEGRREGNNVGKSEWREEQREPGEQGIEGKLDVGEEGTGEGKKEGKSAAPFPCRAELQEVHTLSHLAFATAPGGNTCSSHKSKMGAWHEGSDCLCDGWKACH